jgi:hypothetical protein
MPPAARATAAAGLRCGGGMREGGTWPPAAALAPPRRPRLRRGARACDAHTATQKAHTCQRAVAHVSAAAGRAHAGALRTALQVCATARGQRTRTQSARRSGSVAPPTHATPSAVCAWL